MPLAGRRTPTGLLALTSLVLSVAMVPPVPGIGAGHGRPELVGSNLVGLDRVLLEG